MDSIKTLKRRIKDALDTTGHTNFYGMSAQNNFPYVRYTLSSNYTGRLSNKKAIRNIWYQVDVFSRVPIDVESNESILVDVESALVEEGLYVKDWFENVDTTNSTQYPIYHYFIEVRS